MFVELEHGVSLEKGKCQVRSTPIVSQHPCICSSTKSTRLLVDAPPKSPISISSLEDLEDEDKEIKKFISRDTHVNT